MLLARERARVPVAIERLAGLQAQLARPPFVGLWSRLEGFRRVDLIRALESRDVVRATAMRATLHLMTAKAYLALRPALSPALEVAMRSALRDRTKSFDLDGALAHARAFFEAEPRTMDALRDDLGEKFGDVRAVAYAVRTSLPLVQVPGGEAWGFHGAAPFAVAESWLEKPVRTVPVAKDTQALVRSYLAAFGPASVQDAQTFSGVRGLAETFAQLRDELRVFRDERGRELFDLPKAPRPDEDADAPVRFIPEYDSLILAHDDRSRVMDDAARKAVFRANLMILPSFLVDGRVAGSWKIAKGTLAVQPFAPLSKKTRAQLEEEGLALLAFVEPDAKKHAVRFAR
jgi:hypothetical protein